MKQTSSCPGRPAVGATARWRRLAPACFATFMAFAAPAFAGETDVFDKIVQNVATQELKGVNITANDAKTEQYVAAIGKDGAFPDINYADRSQTNWPAIAHLDRLHAMIVSYVTKGSARYADDGLYDDIIAALQCWYSKNPTSTNWYMWEIGWPQRMGVCLSLMRTGKRAVPADLESKILTRMRSISKGPAQSGSQGTGANKMDIALQWIYRSSLQKNKTDLDFAVQQFFLPLKFNTGEGLQSDWSYLQHGMQLYVGGYGWSVLSATFKVAYYLIGTGYDSDSDYMDYISRFVRWTYMPVIRGHYMLHGAIGRGMVRTNGTNSSGFYGSLQKMIDLDPANTDYYEQGIRRLRGEAPASYGLTPYHRHYWRGDYTLHQRPAYTVDVRMASTRTMRCENGNGENLKGYFLTEGGMQVVQRGDEYVDIYPAWDWARIPGTTTPAVAKVPQPAQWGQSGQSRFAGGVSDSIYGVTAYDMVDKTNGINTTGRKAWFFFDKEVVCLGAAIASGNAAAVNTTVNQCLLHGKVTTLTDEASSADTPGTLAAGKQTTFAGNLRWVNHDSVSYYFPAGGRATVGTQTQSGTWRSLVTTASAAEVKKEVFKLYLDHGVKPSAGTYDYWIVPATASIAEAKATIDDIATTNTDSVQAAYNKTLDLLGIVFHRATTYRTEGIEVSATAPCVLMLRGVSTGSVKAYVADPSQTVDSLTVYAKLPGLAYKALGCRMDRSTFRAGATQQYTIDATTPDSVYVPAETVSLSATSVALGYDNLTAHVTATVSPATATHPELRWASGDEAVVCVDQNGHLVAVGAGSTEVTATTRDGASATVAVSVPDGLTTALPLGDTYIYDKQPTATFGQAGYVTVRRDGTGYNRRGLFLFPIVGLEGKDLTAGNVRVKVVLYETSSYNRAYECKWLFYPCEDTTWSEGTMTWNKRPKTGDLLATIPCFVPAGGDYDARNVVTLDVTDYVLRQKAAGREAITLFVDQNKAATGGKGSTDFASKENADLLKRPRIVTFADKVDGIAAAGVSDAAVGAEVRGDGLVVSGPAGTSVRIYTVGGALIRAFRLARSGRNVFPLAGVPAGVSLVRIGTTVVKICR